MTTYSMTPIKSGTRLRTFHSVFDSVIIQDLSPADTLTGDEIWTAPADGVEVKKNDKWLHVTHRNGVELVEKGWVAFVHKGVAICNNFKEVNSPPPAGTDPVFPLTFTLTDTATGKSALYEFVRVVE